MSELVELRAGAYADSVTLMQVSRDVGARDGVTAAMVAMGTPLNVELVEAMGFALPDGVDANRLLVAIRADDEDVLAAAVAAVDSGLAARPTAASGARADLPPRTVRAAAARGGPAPALALVSVPGQWAFAEAMDALDAGCDVMLFSDNVPLEQELALKRTAAERGLLVMGPDCGTAVVRGAGLGFSHTVDTGPVGIVAASGTGCQQLLCLLDAAGLGVSAALGVGGRDLSAAVGGLGARAALDALDADPETELVVLVSKPPAPEVAARLRAYTSRLTTPVQFALIGETDLTAAAERVLTARAMPVPSWPRWRGHPVEPRPGVLRGLYTGGTLCEEAMTIAEGPQYAVGPVASNVPLRPEDALPPSLHSPDSSMIDFGDDTLTAGRAHPMIDPGLRNAHLAGAVAAPDTAVVLLDVVLGHGAHPDPAAELAPIVARAGCPVVVSLIGARRDPQDLGAQARRLQDAGAHVFASNAQAARFAAGLVAR